MTSGESQSKSAQPPFVIPYMALGTSFYYQGLILTQVLGSQPEKTGDVLCPGIYLSEKLLSKRQSDSFPFSPKPKVIYIKAMGKYLCMDSKMLKFAKKGGHDSIQRIASAARRSSCIIAFCWFVFAVFFGFELKGKPSGRLLET